MNQAHSLQSSPSDNVDFIRSTLNPPSSSSDVHAPYQHPEDVLKISIPEHSSPSESNRNNYLNGYIIWPQKMSPKNRKENLILSYLDSDKHLYKQSEIAGTEQHYFHGIYLMDLMANCISWSRHIFSNNICFLISF